MSSSLKNVVTQDIYALGFDNSSIVGLHIAPYLAYLFEKSAGYTEYLPCKDIDRGFYSPILYFYAYYISYLGIFGNHGELLIISH